MESILHLWNESTAEKPFTLLPISEQQDKRQIIDLSQKVEIELQTYYSKDKEAGEVFEKALERHTAEIAMDLVESKPHALEQPLAIVESSDSNSTLDHTDETI